MVADYELERMETGEKSVKFSSTDEILEIESRNQAAAARANRIRLIRASNNVRARLGLNAKPDNPLLHRTKKIIKLKQAVKRANGQTLNVAPLKSDEIQKSVKSRLSLKNGPEVNKLVNRIGRVSLGSRIGKPFRNGKLTINPPPSSSSSSSVFDRLGFNKK